MACNGLPLYMIDIILDNSMLLFILHLTLKLLQPLGANIVTHHGVSQAIITGYEVRRSTILPVARAKKERKEVRCCGMPCVSNESLPLSSLVRKGGGGGQGII